MKLLAALLLSILSFAVLLLSETASAEINATSTSSAPLFSNESHEYNNLNDEKSSSKAKDAASKDATTKLMSEDELMLLNPIKDILMQEIDTLDKEAINVKMQVNATKSPRSESKRLKVSTSSTTAKPISSTTAAFNATTDDSAITKLEKNEDSLYEDDVSEEEENESKEYDDDGGDSNENEEPDDDEQVLNQCPVYCKCSGAYADVTIATCSKLTDEQSFSRGVVHLRIENAGEIRLGHHAFQLKGLPQLETITIADTRIVELYQTAFEGMQYLFSVNLTRNDLQEIHPNTFQHNKRLSLLAISGNPLKHTQDSKLSKHGLLDVPSATEFDFSYNGLTKLRRNTFSKMTKLTYVNLKGNKLKEIDRETFSMLDSLFELDLSDNLLTELPPDLFHANDIEALRIGGNNLASLSTINSVELRSLDASNNKIKTIGKDDLLGLPVLDTLTLKSNGLKRIHNHALASVSQLTQLYLNNNKLTSLTEYHLGLNTKLQVIVLNDNPELETLPVFTPHDGYTTYSVYRFECSNCGLYFLEEGTFNKMPAITQLNLSRNRLNRLPSGLLSPLSVLGVLDLSDNIIDSLESNMFEGAISLKKLSLAGNPLITLQVTPFLKTPDLTKLDVSRCALERVWSEARVPLTNLRTLSVRQNLLRRITVEELKAMPKIEDLDLSHNPMDCDSEFNEAIQWLTDHGVNPIETARHISNYGSGDAYQDSEGITQWADFAKLVCDGIDDGPPLRPVPHKEKKVKVFIGGDTSEDYSDNLLRSNIESDEELLKLQIDHGISSNEAAETAWTTQDQSEYEDFVAQENMEYHPWYTSALWPVIIVIVITSMILLLTVHIAIHLAKRRGQGPVIRPPMILRQGLIDNKNCGLVYKPLQEEIATPHVPKRGSFYSSSTFHYDKIVPESV